MYASLEAAQDHRRILLLAFLLLCMASLSSHFFAEGLNDYPDHFLAGMNQQAETFQECHEHSEDHFVINSSGIFTLAGLFLFASRTRLFGQRSLVIPPILPPPNR